jgi:hypothetical protein
MHGSMNIKLVVRLFRMSVYGVREDFVLTTKRADLMCFLHNFIPVSEPSPSGHLLQCFLTDLPKKIFVFYVLLTVYLGSILVNNQPDAQFFFCIYLFQFSTCFEHQCAHHQEN